MLRLIRVLTTYDGKAPTTQFGGTYTRHSGLHLPERAVERVALQRVRRAQRHLGLHLQAVAAQRGCRHHHPPDDDLLLHRLEPGQLGELERGHPGLDQRSPKASVEMPNIVTKEARFQPNTSGGSWRTAGFQSGDLIQQNSPALARAVVLRQPDQRLRSGSHGLEHQVKSAQIYMKREDDEATPAANANVYLFWTGYGTASRTCRTPVGLDQPRTRSPSSGPCAKGEGKWFDLPDRVLQQPEQRRSRAWGWTARTRSRPLRSPTTTPGSAAVGQNLRCGELHITWEETL